MPRIVPPLVQSSHEEVLGLDDPDLFVDQRPVPQLDLDEVDGPTPEASPARDLRDLDEGGSR